VSVTIPALPVTKFRVPRLREGAVERVALLRRLEQALDAHPIAVICAPGGSGKTTLLAQLAGRLRSAGTAVVWIAADEEDDDANRFFAMLVQALAPLELAWETPPDELAARVVGAGAQARSALAATVNALCTSAASRVVVVLDDFHRVSRPDALAVLESLIERLPDHVHVVLGTRGEPALPLARWRAHGEVAEFSLADLRFTEAEARALAGGEGALADADASLVDQAWQRTQGWAVGLTLLLLARDRVAALGQGRARSLAASGEAGQGRLFAYLAHEVLGDLPEDLQGFALRSAVLDELTPRLCNAVTGRSDSLELLDELYRRDLFLSVVDDDGPVLRFHDLFREFLQAELARRWPDEVPQLHERAARAEQTSARAIHHYLSAGLWDEALWLVLRVGEQLVSAGAIATVERWIDQIPEAARRGNAHIAYLRGSCAWLRWDWMRARRELAAAAAGLTAPLEAQSRVRAYFQWVDALSSSGDLVSAWRTLDEAASLPLDDLGRADHALLRAWCHAADGRLESVARDLEEFVTLAERDPARVCPVTAGRIHCLLIGMPGVVEVFDRFAAASHSISGTTHAPWQLAALAVEGWVRLWRGDFDASQQLVERAASLYQQFGGIRLVGERLGQLRALHASASGQHAAALALARRHVEGMQAPELARHRASWLRAYQHGFARMLWMAGQHEEFLAAVPALTAPRRAEEWPFVEVAAQTVRGQAALLQSTPRVAVSILERACEGYRQHCLPSVFCDPRIALASAHLALRDRARAWVVFEPVYRDAADAGLYGPLLLDSRRQVLALIDGLAANIDDPESIARVKTLLATWTGSAQRGGAPNQAGPLARLTEREVEVLAAVAEGAGNKHIARALDLSLHTVKRHIANILDKLDCASRGQAAEMYRRTNGGRSA
jgi:LuxR family maltose regulon positive regulatory protein